MTWKTAVAIGVGSLVAGGFSEYRLASHKASLAESIVTQKVIVTKGDGASVKIGVVGDLASVMVDTPGGGVHLMASGEQSTVHSFSVKCKAIMSANENARVDLIEPRASTWLVPQYGLTINRGTASVSFPPYGDGVIVPD